MNAFVSELVQQQNEAIDHPRFVAVCETTVRERNPRLIDMWDADYAVRVPTGWLFANDAPGVRGQYETNRYAEAQAAALGMLFCGASDVSIHWYSVDRRFETVETWRAV